MGRKAGQTKYEKERDRKKNNQRSEIEGKFGEAKNRYGLDRLYTRLPETSQAEISLIFLAVNLVKLIREIADGLFFALRALLDSVMKVFNMHAASEYAAFYQLEVAHPLRRHRSPNAVATF